MSAIESYSQSVVSRVNESSGGELKRTINKEGYGVIDIAMIIGIVLPILANLPCLKSNGDDLSSQKATVESHPNLAIARAAQEIRKQARLDGEKTTRKYSKELATEIVNDFLSSSEDEINEVLES